MFLDCLFSREIIIRLNKWHLKNTPPWHFRHLPESALTFHISYIFFGAYPPKLQPFKMDVSIPDTGVDHVLVSGGQLSTSCKEQPHKHRSIPRLGRWSQVPTYGEYWVAYQGWGAGVQGHCAHLWWILGSISRLVLWSPGALCPPMANI